MAWTRSTSLALACVLLACGDEEPADDAGQTVTTSGDATSMETGDSTGDSTGDGDGDASCLETDDPAACCEQAGGELDACTAAGCGGVDSATTYDDQCQPIEVVDMCYPIANPGMLCLGTVKPDDCQLSAGDEMIYREIAPGEFVFVLGFELCVDGVPGWSHCFEDPRTDPPGCLCAC